VEAFRVARSISALRNNIDRDAPAMGSFPLRARETVPLIALAVFSVGTWLLLLYYWKTVIFILVVLIFTYGPSH
jgi:hypothetical protein